MLASARSTMRSSVPCRSSTRSLRALGIPVDHSQIGTCPLDCQVEDTELSRLVRSVPVLHSLEMSPLKERGCVWELVENCSGVFQGAVGARSSRPPLRQL